MNQTQRLGPIDPLLQQAKTAVQQKNQAKARRLLQQAVQQDPQDYRGWLWLASVAQTPQASLEYVNRADMLAPNNATVQKARRWAEKRVRPTQEQASDEVHYPAADNRRRWPQIARWLGIILVILLLGVGTVYAWQYLRSGGEPVAETAVLSSNLSPNP